MMGVDKKSIRQSLRARRRVLEDAFVRAAGEAVHRQICELSAYRDAASVAAYLPDENEVPTQAILAEAERDGKAVYLPRTTPPAGFVRWHAEEPLQPSSLQVLEPVTGDLEEPVPPALALLPLVAWDRHGARLGRGAGYYDRLLAGFRTRPTCVGLAYEFQEITEVPRDPWDIPMQFVITERRVVCCESAVCLDSSEKGGLP